MINKKLKNGSLIYICNLNKILKVYDSFKGMYGAYYYRFNQLTTGSFDMENGQWWGIADYKKIIILNEEIGNAKE